MSITFCVNKTRKDNEKKKVALDQVYLSVFSLLTIAIIPSTLCSNKLTIGPITRTSKQSLETCKAMFFQTSRTYGKNLDKTLPALIWFLVSNKRNMWKKEKRNKQLSSGCNLNISSKYAQSRHLKNISQKFNSDLCNVTSCEEMLKTCTTWDSK